jgi:hypothetical protein
MASGNGDVYVSWRIRCVLAKLMIRASQARRSNFAFVADNSGLTFGIKVPPAGLGGTTRINSFDLQLHLCQVARWDS